VSSPAGEDTDAADAAAVTVRAAQQTVFTVHATLANEVRPTEAVFSGSQAACEHAEASSTDPGVLAASVVRFTVNELGTRRGWRCSCTAEGKRSPTCRTVEAFTRVAVSSEDTDRPHRGPHPR
jgi:hypothetical protein